MKIKFKKVGIRVVCNELADRMGIGKRKTVSGVRAADGVEQFDPSEIGLMESVHISSTAGIKIGRNEPCP